MNSKDQETREKVRNWWSTEIIDMHPGKIRIRGEDIEELIGNISFVQMIWLMLRVSCPPSKKHVCWKQHWLPQWIMARRPLRLLLQG